jgi:hypothetical protein
MTDNVPQTVENEYYPVPGFAKLPQTFAERIASIPAATLAVPPEDIEDDLDLKLRHLKLRARFHAELLKAEKENRQVVIKHIYEGIMPAPLFYNFINNQLALTWLLHPPSDFQETVKVIYSELLEQLHVIATTTVLKVKRGNCIKEIDPKKAELALKAYQMISDRIDGTPVNRAMNVNVNKDTTSHASGVAM